MEGFLHYTGMLQKHGEKIQGVTRLLAYFEVEGVQKRFYDERYIKALVEHCNKQEVVLGEVSAIAFASTPQALLLEKDAIRRVGSVINRQVTNGRLDSKDIGSIFGFNPNTIRKVLQSLDVHVRGSNKIILASSLFKRLRWNKPSVERLIERKPRSTLPDPLFVGFGWIYANIGDGHVARVLDGHISSHLLYMQASKRGVRMYERRYTEAFFAFCRRFEGSASLGFMAEAFSLSHEAQELQRSGIDLANKLDDYTYDGYIRVSVLAALLGVSKTAVEDWGDSKGVAKLAELEARLRWNLPCRLID